MSDSTIMTRLRSRQKQAIIIVSLSSSSKPLIKRIIHPIELKRGPSIIMASLLFLLSIKNLDLSVKYVIAKIQILLIMETTTLSIFIESAGDRAPASAVVPPTMDCNHTMKVRQGISTLPYLQRILTYKIFSTLDFG